MTLHIARLRTLEKYHSALRNFPAPGQGKRHAYLLTCANLGSLAGIPSEQLIDEILVHVPLGGRRVTRMEVTNTVATAYRDRAEGYKRTFAPKPKPKPRSDADRFWGEARALYGDCDPIGELWERSPVALDFPPQEGRTHLLAALYAEDEHIFIGGAKERGVPGDNLRTARAWRDFINAGGKLGPHIMINPLSGKKAETRSGSMSYRCDAAVSAHRYCLVEFDGIPIEDQALFWLHARLPVAAIIDSGGKSLHGWIRLDCPDSQTWDREIRPFYDNVVVPLGADRACKNPARMSRTPGVLRGDRYQRLLYLAPAGKAVSA